MLDAAHQRDLPRIFELHEEVLLLATEAVLPGDRTAERHAGAEDRGEERAPLLDIGLEHRKMHVAVARVTTPDDERGVLLREGTDGRDVFGDRGARHDHVDDVVGTGRLRNPERL